LVIVIKNASHANPLTLKFKRPREVQQNMTEVHHFEQIMGICQNVLQQKVKSAVLVAHWGRIVGKGKKGATIIKGSHKERTVNDREV